MYGVVVLMALSSGAESPELFNRGGCRGSSCSGCCGTVVVTGCSGSCSGSCHGTRKHRERRHSCHGCNGCSGTVIYSSCCGGAAAMPKADPHKKPDDGKKPDGGKKPDDGKKPPKPNDGKKPDGKEEISAPATLTINVPADATLTIDGYTISSRSEKHIYVTLPLASDSTQKHTLTLTGSRTGQAVSTTKEVTVSGGQELSVSLDFAANVAAR